MNIFLLGDLVTKLAAATVLGGLVGWQREARDRPAGLRTHVLVCLGSAIYTLTSLGFGGRADPSRVAAQVATGVGFLGAGTIMRHGNEVRGLTTAASLWAVAAIGICVGMGGNTYWVAVLGTVLVLLTLTLFRRLEMHFLMRTRFATITVRIAGGPERIPEVQQYLTDKNVRVESMDVTSAEGGQEVHVGLRLPPGVDPTKLMGDLSAIPGLQALRCD